MKWKDKTVNKGEKKAKGENEEKLRSDKKRKYRGGTGTRMGAVRWNIILEFARWRIIIKLTRFFLPQCETFPRFSFRHKT